MGKFLENKHITRELSIQIQFLAILVFTSFGWYGLVHFQGGGDLLSLAELFGRLVLYWLTPFIVFCAIKVSVTYFQNRGGTATEPIVSVEGELATTLIYAIFGTLSVYLSFCLLLLTVNSPDIAINIKELWISLRPMFCAWIIGFNLLGALRFGLVVINEHVRLNVPR